MKRKIIYLAVFIIIFIAGAMTGIIFAGYHTSKALKLLTYNEIAKFEHARTTAVESPIPIPFMAELVTAKVGHIPIT